jgi:hypothetical protein
MDDAPDFVIQEFLHPSIYLVVGSRARDFLHTQAIPTIQLLRTNLNTPIVINNWAFSGLYEDSGLRQPYAQIGKQYSAHKFGCGFDLKLPDLGVDAAYAEIMDNPERYPWIIRIENIEATRSKYGKLGLDWIHIEIGYREVGKPIIVFNP